MKSLPTIVFFDVDHTLIPKTSVEAVFIKWLFWHGKISISRVYAVLRFFLSHLDDVSGTALRGNKMYLKGIQYDDAFHCAVMAFNKSLPGIVSKDGIQEIRRLQKGGGSKVVLLSASPAPLVEQVCKYVGADDSISTILEKKDKVLTGRIVGLHPYGRRKTTAAIQYAQKLGVALYDCVVYANAYSDFPFLRVVGEAVAVNPDRRLRGRANRYGWKSLIFK